MAAACSMDLRTRDLKDADNGLSSKEVVERYHARSAWLDGLKQRRRETRAFGQLKQMKLRRPVLVERTLARLANVPGGPAPMPRSGNCGGLAQRRRADDVLAHPESARFHLQKRSSHTIGHRAHGIAKIRCREDDLHTPCPATCLAK
jgi:hypothetical protein